MGRFKDYMNRQSLDGPAGPCGYFDQADVNAYIRGHVVIWGPDEVRHIHKPRGAGDTQPLKDAEGRTYSLGLCDAHVPFPPKGASTILSPTCDDCLSISGVTPGMFEEALDIQRGRQ